MKLSRYNIDYADNYDYNFNLLDGLIIGLIVSGVVLGLCLLAVAYSTARLLLSLIRPVESPTIC